MARLVDLPEDVVEMVFKYLVKIDDRLLEGLGSRSQVESSTAARLRLVCRKWADWFFVHHLFRTLNFSDGAGSLAFIRKLTRPGSTPSSVPPRRPRCQHMMVYDIWTPTNGPEPSYVSRTDQPARTPPRGMMNTFESLDTLVSFFADTIVELDLEFITCFWLPRRTIELIGQIENLRVLRLALKSEWLSGGPSLAGPGENTLLSDRSGLDESTGILDSLISAARGLESLDLSQLPIQYIPKSFPAQLATHPTITQLDIKLTDEQPLESLISLSKALKPSLKVLSIQSFRDDGFRLVPIFETLRENLEGLFISHESALTHILHFDFPNLRVFRIHYWDHCIADFLSQDLFSRAPIQLIALYSHTVYRRKRPFLVDPFARLNRLKKIVFLHARLGDSPPLNYINACRAHRLQLIYLNHGTISEIMKLCPP
ncbi:hypothetical protein PGT21_018096 [Puccinia graminis f. sp. tritici]|uniref:Uncharacterized protein n=1 Tax=Puccinia graminis f. sp. tritici TaxID=56615 RepID=A0A5B0LUL0_PUCGR|nr:hypothetical protein PGTUg99_034718 [Puccinia graminis f. sp. tritici]KAA1104283.1 hypothetical protein PGT21_018096 [Puccinia graminis f. sp. tritici]